MKKSNKHTLLIVLGAVALLVAVVVYIIFPLHQERINRQAVAAEAASYYDDQFVEDDSSTIDSARQMAEGRYDL